MCLAPSAVGFTERVSSEASQRGQSFNSHWGRGTEPATAQVAAATVTPA